MGNGQTGFKEFFLAGIGSRGGLLADHVKEHPGLGIRQHFFGGDGMAKRDSRIGVLAGLKDVAHGAIALHGFRLQVEEREAGI